MNRLPASDYITVCFLCAWWFDLLGDENSSKLNMLTALTWAGPAA